MLKFFPPIALSSRNPNDFFSQALSALNLLLLFFSLLPLDFFLARMKIVRFTMHLPAVALAFWLALVSPVLADCSSLNDAYVGMQFASSDACFTYLTQQVVGSPNQGGTIQTCLQDYMVCVGFSSMAVMSFASVAEQQVVSIYSFSTAIVEFQSNAMCEAAKTASTFYSTGVQSISCSLGGRMTIQGSSGSPLFMTRLSTSGAVVGTVAVSA